MLRDNKTKEDLQAEIDKIMKGAQRKINKILKEAHFEVSAYEAEIELFDSRGNWGFCHSFWPVRKRILKEKYNIDWQTPAEQNPGIIYD